MLRIFQGDATENPNTMTFKKEEKCPQTVGGAVAAASAAWSLGRSVGGRLGASGAGVAGAGQRLPGGGCGARSVCKPA